MTPTPREGHEYESVGAGERDQRLGAALRFVRYRSTSDGVSHQSRPRFVALSRPAMIAWRMVAGSIERIAAASLTVTAASLVAGDAALVDSAPVERGRSLRKGAPSMSDDATRRGGYTQPAESRSCRSSLHAPVLDELTDPDEPVCARCGEAIDFDGRWFHARDELQPDELDGDTELPRHGTLRLLGVALAPHRVREVRIAVLHQVHRGLAAEERVLDVACLLCGRHCHTLLLWRRSVNRVLSA